jgi:hypothetical protein
VASVVFVLGVGPVIPFVNRIVAVDTKSCVIGVVTVVPFAVDVVDVVPFVVGVVAVVSFVDRVIAVDFCAI